MLTHALSPDHTAPTRRVSAAELAARLRGHETVRAREADAVVCSAPSRPLGETDDADQPLSPERHRLVADHLSLARSLASRYAMGNHNNDDLVQVASMGLVLAARRFDASRGVPFAAYAKPTIVGELRRYFRDHGWSVRVPRGLQELAVDVHRVEGDGLSDDRAIAQELDVAEQEVVHARQARHEALTSKSLDFPLADDSGEVLGDLLGQRDPELELVEQREALQTVLPHVPDRERRILLMRFFGDKSQTEIAELLGVSQVHVSRLLNRTIHTLREHLIGDKDLPPAWTHSGAVAPG